MLEHAGMDQEEGWLTNAEVRRRRLVQLSGQVDGGLPGIAKLAGVSAQNLDHIIKRRKQGTVRADGSQPAAAMGDKLARTIEMKVGLTDGWLDWPFPHVDFDAFAQLSSEQMVMVQLRLSDAVKEQFAKPKQLSLPDVPTPVHEEISAGQPARKKATSAAARKSLTRSEVALEKPGNMVSRKGYVRLKTVDDLENARVSAREAELHRRIEKYPKARGK